MAIDEFIKKYLGKQVEYHSFGAGAFNQCVDLVNAYINEVLDTKTKDYTEIIGTNAKDFNTKYDPEDFEWIVNTPTAVVQKGDIVVWNGRVGGGVGHVAIAIEGDVNKFKSLDQNWSQKERVTLEIHNYSNVTGWLRSKKAENKATIEVFSDVFENLVEGSTVRDQFVAAGFPNVETVLERIKRLEEEKAGVRAELEGKVNTLDGEKKKLHEDLKTCKLQVEDALKTAQKATEEDISALDQGIDAQHELDDHKKDLDVIKQALDLPYESTRKDVIDKIQALKKPTEEIAKTVVPIMEELFKNVFRNKKSLSFFQKIRKLLHV